MTQRAARTFYHQQSLSPDFPDMNFVLTTGYESEEVKYKASSLPINLSISGLPNLLQSPDNMLFRRNRYAINSESPSMAIIFDENNIFNNHNNNNSVNHHKYNNHHQYHRNHRNIGNNRNHQTHQKQQYHDENEQENHKWRLKELLQRKKKMVKAYNISIKQIDDKFMEYEQKIISQIHAQRDVFKEFMNNKHKQNIEIIENLQQKNFGQYRNITKIIQKKSHLKKQQNKNKEKNKNNNNMIAQIKKSMDLTPNINQLKQLYGNDNVFFDGQDYVVSIHPMRSNVNELKTKPKNKSVKKMRNALFEALHDQGIPGFSPSCSPESPSNPPNEQEMLKQQQILKMHKRQILATAKSIFSHQEELDHDNDIIHNISMPNYMDIDNNSNDMKDIMINVDSEFDINKIIEARNSINPISPITPSNVIDIASPSLVSSSFNVSTNPSINISQQPIKSNSVPAKFGMNNSTQNIQNKQNKNTTSTSVPPQQQQQQQHAMSLRLTDQIPTALLPFNLDEKCNNIQKNDDMNENEPNHNSLITTLSQEWFDRNSNNQSLISSKPSSSSTPSIPSMAPISSIPIAPATVAPMQFGIASSISSTTSPSIDSSIDVKQESHVSMPMMSPGTICSDTIPTGTPPPVTISTSSSLPPKKRGRGRPKKEVGIQENDISVISSKKRGRGRPRKYPLEQDENVNNTQKRGRGRPRKQSPLINEKEMENDNDNDDNNNDDENEKNKTIIKQSEKLAEMAAAAPKPMAIMPKLQSVNGRKLERKEENENNDGRNMRFNVIITNHTSCSAQRKNRSKNLECIHCHKLFATNYELTRHLRIHTGERPYKCPICNKGFKQKQHMITHKKSVHDNYRPFKCELCGKPFKEKGTLTKHIQYTHNATMNKLDCHLCDKSFKRKGNLKSHLKRVHNQYL